MKKCPYCGHGNDEQAKTCERCSAGLPVVKREESEPKKVQKQEVKKHGT